MKYIPPDLNTDDPLFQRWIDLQKTNKGYEFGKKRGATLDCSGALCQAYPDELGRDHGSWTIYNKQLPNTKDISKEDLLSGTGLSHGDIIYMENKNRDNTANNANHIVQYLINPNDKKPYIAESTSHNYGREGEGTGVKITPYDMFHGRITDNYSYGVGSHPGIQSLFNQPATTPEPLSTDPIVTITPDERKKQFIENIKSEYTKTDDKFLNPTLQRYFEVMGKENEGIKRNDGKYSTHSMVTIGDETGHYVVPTVYKEEGAYKDYGDLDVSSLNEKAINSNERLGPYQSENEASFVAENYKNLFGISPETYGDEYDNWLDKKQQELLAKKENDKSVLNPQTEQTATTVPAPTTTAPPTVTKTETTDTTETPDKYMQDQMKLLNEMRAMYQAQFDRDTERTSRIEKGVKAKTIFDLAANTGMLFQNMRNNNIDDMKASTVPIPSIPSMVQPQQNMLNRMTDTAYATGTRLAREMGRPEMATGMIANTLEQQARGQAEISGQELQRQSQEAQIQQQAQAINAQAEMQAEAFNIKNRADAAAKLSEVNAGLMSNFSEILKSHIESYATIEEQKDTALTLLELQKLGVKQSELEMLLKSAMLGLGGGNQTKFVPSGNTGARTTTNPTTDNEPKFDADGNPIY